MQLFPAYTIATIEQDLSWREVKELMQISNEKITTKTRIDRIELMIEKYLKITFGDQKHDDKTTLNILRGLGWL